MFHYEFYIHKQCIRFERMLNMNCMLSRMHKTTMKTKDDSEFLNLVVTSGGKVFWVLLNFVFY